MANLTAVTGNWTSTAATNTAFGGASTTTAADQITIPNGVTVTIVAANSVLCRNLTVAAGGTLVFAATTSAVSIGDATAGTSNVALSISSTATITLTGIGTINYVSTSATTQTIATGGKTLPNETFNATSNGSWQFSDNHTSSGAITLTKGTLDTNGKTVSSVSFASSNSNVRTLTLGSSTFTVTGNNNAWNVPTTTNLTVTANTATCTVAGDRFISDSLNWNGMSLTFTTTTGQILQTTGTVTVANLTKAGTAAANTLTLTGDITVTNAVTFTGVNNSAQRITILSSPIGTARTIAIGASGTFKTNCSNANFQDITATGGALNERDLSAITGLSGDNGGNTGITFTPAAPQYIVGITNNTIISGTSSTAWASSSGGSPGTGRFPLPQDDVYLDSGSGVGGGTARFTGGTLVSLGKNFIVNTTNTIDLNFNGTTNLFGSLTITALGGGVIGSATITFFGRGSQTIDFGGKTAANTVVIAGAGTYALASHTTISGSFTVTSGAFDTANYNLTSSTFLSSGSLTRTITLGTSTITLTSVAATSVINVNATGLTLSAASSTFVVANASANLRTMSLGGPLTYGTIDYTVAGSTGGLDITNMANSHVYDIRFSDASNARTLRINAAQTLYFDAPHALTGVVGTGGKLMTVSSSTAASPVSLRFPNGFGGGSDYLSVRDVTAVTNTWYAGANSTNVSGNTNVTFTAAPATATGGFFQFF